MLTQFILWYLVVQLITLVALPWTLRLFSNLPDRGYVFAKSLGILLVGVVFWLGYSYGLIRNETGGVWISLVLVAIAGWFVGRVTGQNPARQQGASDGETSNPQSPISNLQSLFRERWRYILLVELLFLAAFAFWALVRMNDPSVDHTEEPMDLMFMNSIWNSATYPPQDAWLSGYAISYYYMGYWLLMTIARLANQPPEIAYNLGQASWYGFLIIGCFGIVYNLLAARKLSFTNGFASIRNYVGGLLACIFVAMSGNMLGVIEWVHANGVNMRPVAEMMSLDRFLEEAKVTNKWYIDDGAPWGWMWRTSRVLSDTHLDGGRSEVIDEYPLFSYILGDNHPHVLTMPFVLLLIALALNLFLQARGEQASAATNSQPDATAPPRLQLVVTHWLEWIVLSLALGALIPLNTWDLPAYWLLLILAFFAVRYQHNRQLTLANVTPWVATLIQSVIFAASLIVGALILFFPYLLTAQSQAGGIAPNLFNPTRLGQFLAMFAPQALFALGVIALLWSNTKVEVGKLVTSLVLCLGLPILLILASAFIANQRAAQGRLDGLEPLPASASGYLSVILGRWTTQGWTFVLIAILLSFAVALLWQRLVTPAGQQGSTSSQDRLPIDTFVLFLAGIGLLYILIPEVVFLRDVFGSRMNTIFKFYYQSWLLLGLAGAYLTVRVLDSQNMAARLIAALGAVLSLAALIIFPSAVYSRTNGFGNPQPTFDATAYVTLGRPAEAAAVKWIEQNVAPDALILQAWGDSYHADHNWISSATGRRTLIGWGGHEGQWRGNAYPTMSAGRMDALEDIYRRAPTDQIPALLDQWKIDYVYIGGAERQRYQIGEAEERRLQETMDLAFEEGDVRLYKRRSP
ncbi:MAG: DUF2298 domain-containing protein [Caldilineaceae bacterium]